MAGMRKTAVTIALLAAIPLSIAYFDQPLTLWAHAQFHGIRQTFHTLTRVVEPIELLAMLGLIWCGARFAFGRLARPEIALLRLSLAVLTAIGVKDLLKLAFGRTWPETWTNGNPSFIADHAYYFAPFHGGLGWSAFPSGHQTVTAAFCGALWILAPRLRLLCAAVMLVVAIGLIGADEHWLSDVIAGGLVGWLIGVLMTKIELPKTDSPRLRGECAPRVGHHASSAVAGLSSASSSSSSCSPSETLTSSSVSSTTAA
ncbi:phosphatase PAP2 family protein [Rhodoblastus acidophilus]|uniref:Phosphatase PAP2 family protein n=2 Tax=Rhodoblastus acidophilus TaxID=1074 RepID=A0A6N8DMZ7_RHOAC|nr:phosphatase PAP2 family protein [Rhodoblastus acidophilus]